MNVELSLGDTLGCTVLDVGDDDGEIDGKSVGLNEGCTLIGRTLGTGVGSTLVGGDVGASVGGNEGR